MSMPDGTAQRLSGELSIRLARVVQALKQVGSVSLAEDLAAIVTRGAVSRTDVTTLEEVFDVLERANQSEGLGGHGKWVQSPSSKGARTGDDRSRHSDARRDELSAAIETVAYTLVRTGPIQVGDPTLLERDRSVLHWRRTCPTVSGPLEGVDPSGYGRLRRCGHCRPRPRHSDLSGYPTLMSGGGVVRSAQSFPGGAPGTGRR